MHEKTLSTLLGVVMIPPTHHIKKANIYANTSLAVVAAATITIMELLLASVFRRKHIHLWKRKIYSH